VRFQLLPDPGGDPQHGHLLHYLPGSGRIVPLRVAGIAVFVR
jgi:hypothetical protein